MNHNRHPKNDHDHLLPNQPFFQWLKSHSSLYIGNIIGLCSTAYLIFALFYYSDPHGGIGKYFTTEKIQTFIFVAHIVFIVLCVFKLIQILDDNKVGSYRTGMVYRRIFNENPNSETYLKIRNQCKIVIRKFKLFFILFWISMLALYMSFLFNDKGSSKHSIDAESQGLAAGNEKNEYGKVNEGIHKTTFPDSIISENVVEESKLKENSTRIELEFHTNKFSDAFQHIKNEFITFVMNNISLMFIFWCFTILYMPPLDDKSRKSQIRLVNFSVFITLLINLAFPFLLHLASNDGIYTHLSLIGFVTVFNALSGTLNAIVLALLIARLDSKLVGLPSWLVAILYSYSAVQPLFVAFDQPGSANETIKTTVLLVVFIFKIYFFFIILYALQTGRLLNYFFCFPTLNKRVNAIFQNQFEIFIQKEDAEFFNFTIKKNNSTIFSTDGIFKSREDCRKGVELLMDMAKHKVSYEKIESTNGTYILNLYDGNKLLCFSSNLKSMEEVDDLIDESMEKIPYCKFDYS